jgi:ubiquinone/menaquinone biosynthesis C-methylase UbiE
MLLKSRVAQSLFGAELAIRDSWEETPAKFDDMAAFLNWFDTTDSVESAVRKGQEDWRHRFASFPHFAGLKRHRGLEIGFGGGRLLCHACRDFGEVIGVDIHKAFDRSRLFLDSQGCRNYRLLHRDDIGAVADASVDFVYSFIVFQHFDSIAEVDYYFDHIDRVLTNEGIAHIYFGKNKKDGVGLTPENHFRLRDCSLLVAPPLMRERVAERFTVIDFEDMLPRDPVSKEGESAQAMVIFRKS